jgi:hypothetical protein
LRLPVVDADVPHHENQKDHTEASGERHYELQDGVDEIRVRVGVGDACAKLKQQKHESPEPDQMLQSSNG